MSLFITGTGTNVGKTVVTAGLAALLKSQGRAFCIYKPVQTGCENPDQPEDPLQIQAWVGDDVLVHCTYCFPAPAAPYAADPGRTIDPHKLLLDFKRLQKEYGTVLVEGAGGVRVPVAKHFEMIDLIRMFQIPSLIVAGPGLGTINHTLLTLEAFEHRRMEMKGVVISGMPESSNDPAVSTLLETLEPFMSAPLIGTLPVLSLEPGTFSDPKTLTLFEDLKLFGE